MPAASGLQPLVVIVTGASQGIGAACARAYAARGAKLSLNARSEDALRALGIPGAVLTPGDITAAETRERLIRNTLDAFGAIDILINNAGVGVYSPPSLADEAQSRRLFDVNFFAPMALCQLAVPHMRSRRSGIIVNITSIAGKIPLPWMGVYSATKSALASFTDALRMELAPSGVHAMNVYPGYVDTNFHRNATGDAPQSLVRGRRFAISAETCARDILRGIDRRAHSVTTPSWGRLFVAAYRLLPRAVESRLAAMSGPGPHATLPR